MTVQANHISLTGVYKKWPAVLILLAGFIFVNDAGAQYFGRNKPGYRSFRFDVVQTPDFEIYH